MNLGICQMKVVNKKEENIKKAENMIRKLAEEGSETIILPEMFNCPYDNSRFQEYAETQDGPTITRLKEVAKELKVHIIAGSIPEKTGEGIYNTSFIINPEGDIIGRHRKIHLFNINIPGKITFRESDTLLAGETPTIIKVGNVKIGVGICYDIRFPELSRIMTLKGASILAFPGAFNMVTGPAHWKTLIRARAIDNQVFVVAASPARDKKAEYVAYGHSMVADPWGSIIYEAGADETIKNVEIDLSQVENVRRRLPLLENRRPEIYDEHPH
ncbi:MAG: carbon-nitrogen hydrolase family protein [Methanobacteriales archaeon]|nr:carbon-nitrogen hydrolase family protein [Methanobacteriales archaeon]MBC7118079.1 carbon-nitrogen hydrolase family protein [Methanobacteriaceae archaeon]